jgi:hypothetical protein
MHGWSLSGAERIRCAICGEELTSVAFDEGAAERRTKDALRSMHGEFCPWRTLSVRLCVDDLRVQEPQYQSRLKSLAILRDVPVLENTLAAVQRDAPGVEDPITVLAMLGWYHAGQFVGPTGVRERVTCFMCGRVVDVQSFPHLAKSTPAGSKRRHSFPVAKPPIGTWTGDGDFDPIALHRPGCAWVGKPGCRPWARLHNSESQRVGDDDSSLDVVDVVRKYLRATTDLDKDGTGVGTQSPPRKSFQMVSP